MKGKTACFACWLLLLAVGALPALEKVASAAEEFPKVKIYGFARVRYTIDLTKGKSDGFSIASSRIGVTGPISKDFNFAFIMETVNTDQENRKMVYDAYIDTTIIPRFKIRAGQFKYGFGLEQSTPDADLELINKSDVVTNLVKPTRDIGLQVARDFSFGKTSSTLILALINGSGSNLEDENSRKTFVGRILVTPVRGLTMGGSLYSGTAGAANDKKERAGAEIKYETWRLLAKAEYIRGKDKEVQKDGYYLTLGYNVAPSWLLLVRYDHWRPERGQAGKDLSRWTIGVNRFIGKNIVWRTNYEHRLESPSVDNDLIMTQIQVKF